MSRSSVAVMATTLLYGATAWAQQLPPVPVPAENPITEEKRVLGKILFWDAQLSSDNTMACGTCHINGSGGTDPRVGINPGLDGLFGTADDKESSPGVIHSDANDDFLPDSVFGLNVQVTGRTAPPSVTAMFAPSLFWDGRATGTFTDPQSGLVAIANGGALESQAVGPPLSTAEMSHEGRDWNQITAKLTTARPLALATNLPPDVAAAIAANPSYPALFAAAFPGGQVTSRNIAFAIATYERTLVANQTPFDMGTMTPQQQQGFGAFQAPGARCAECHPAPLFTDNTFRNIGLRPIGEDTGRQSITGIGADAGRFKVPGLRNIGLKSNFMHNGQHTTLEEVIDFYRGVNGQIQFPQNQDPLIPPIFIPGFAQDNLLNFLRNALTDPRVANETFPFDRPTLHTELADNPRTVGFGTAGTSGVEPVMIAHCPPVLGSQDFKLGVSSALGGANASVAFSRTPQLPDGTLDAFQTLGPIVLGGIGAGNGFGTLHWPIADNPALLGDNLYVQWMVEDPAAAGGIARTPVAVIQFYASDPTQCECTGDLDCNQTIDVDDIIEVITRWGSCDLCSADLNNDSVIDVDDLIAVILNWGSCL